jgi:formate--tetrahydrofolate ligase
LPKPITSVAASLGISEHALIPYGREMAKVDLSVLDGPRLRTQKPRLVLVSAITPTKAGEGKTTTTIGLGDGLARIGESVCIALREPSLGPCLGAKGGGTGGGRSQLVPSDRINLHFTGDFHAITSAHNLLAAAIDNHLHFETDLNIEPRRVLWPRVIDMNDRTLRNLVIGMGGKANGIPREASFDITAASELMAMLCLSSDLDDLRMRIDRTLVAFTKDDKPVIAKQIGVTGAMLALLRDAIHPNLVQTQSGTPAFVHGGPFANIAHGCNSLIATRAAMHFADWTVTEAGFGFDLGAEKFYDIKLRSAGLDTAAVVLVATVRALKMHGGQSITELTKPDGEAVRRGLPNLIKHIENIRCFGETPIVALNRFHADTDEEIQVVRAACRELMVPFSLSDHYAKGAEGAVDLARTVVEHAEKESRPFTPLYPLEAPVPAKILAVASQMYGARSVVYSKRAEADLRDIARLGYEKLPVCIAKTQNSLSDDPKLGGRPTDFDVTVRNIRINSGAGFLVVLTGEILRMPGLPKKPAAENIDVENGVIKNLF